MVKAGLNVVRYQKKYRTLGRWNRQLSMNTAGLILLLYFGGYSEPPIIQQQKTRSIKTALFIES
jgi:hypothetical protein